MTPNQQREAIGRTRHTVTADSYILSEKPVLRCPHTHAQAKRYVIENLVLVSFNYSADTRTLTEFVIGMAAQDVYEDLERSGLKSFAQVQARSSAFQWLQFEHLQSE